nr:rhomboid family intramembrane serine protease [Saprospiraceae bacterium]
MLRVTDVVKNLLIINVIVFFAVRYLLPFPGIERFFILIYPGVEFMEDGFIYKFEPVQIITHMFMHADERHLLFNMLGLYFLGPWVEASLGPKRFLTMYLLSGFVATSAQMLISQSGGVGASGAVYGV